MVLFAINAVSTVPITKIRMIRTQEGLPRKLPGDYLHYIAWNSLMNDIRLSRLNKNVGPSLDPRKFKESQRNLTG